MLSMLAWRGGVRVARRVGGAAGAPLPRVAAARRLATADLPSSRRRLLPTTRPAPAPAAAAAAAAAGGAATPSTPSLAHLPPDIRAEVTRALELAERASRGWALAHTDFLTPPAAAAALAALAGRADVSAVAWGGWAGAERVRLVLGQPDRLAEELSRVDDGAVVVLPDDDGRSSSGPPPPPLPPPPGAAPPPALTDPAIGGVAAVSLRGRFTFEAASHRDFLGATLNGAGLDRRVVGDILLDGERGATVFVAPGVVEAVEAGVTAVRGVSVTAAAVDPGAVRLPAPPPPPTPVHSTEASLRLDAVASAGFRTSRAKMAGLIKAGSVKLNYVPTSKGAAVVGAGDIISCAGKGRVEVVEVGVTSKGRWRVEMLRFS